MKKYRVVYWRLVICGEEEGYDCYDKEFDTLEQAIAFFREKRDYISHTSIIEIAPNDIIAHQEGNGDLVIL